MTRNEDVVAGVLDRMERHKQIQRMAVIAAALVEALLIGGAIVLMNWKDRAQVLVFLFSMVGYTILALGFLALGAHVSRVGARVVAALDQSRTG